MDLDVPEKEDVSVRPATQYATLWSQYLSEASGSTVFYYLLGPFFFTRFLIVSLYSPSLVVVTNPEVYPLQIPSTATAPDTPVAYTAEKSYDSIRTSYISRITRIPSLLYFTIYAYIKRESIAYIVLDDEEEPLVDSEEYFVTEDEDSLRPIILFRD